MVAGALMLGSFFILTSIRSILPHHDLAVRHPWWRHQMEAFSALLAICAGNSPVNGESTAQRPVTRSFDVFFDLRLNKRLSKQSWGWWFETLSRPLWRHCNALVPMYCTFKKKCHLIHYTVHSQYDILKLCRFTTQHRSPNGLRN